MLRRTPATAHSIVERNQALLLRNVALELHEIKILETIKGKIHADGAINFNDFQACQAFLSSRGRETFLRDPARFIEAQKKVADLVRNAKLGSQTSPVCVRPFIFLANIHCQLDHRNPSKLRTRILITSSTGAITPACRHRCFKIQPLSQQPLRTMQHPATLAAPPRPR